MVDWHGQPAVSLSSPDGARALILLQGAQLLSWQRPDGEEQLYLSDQAVYATGQAVRGGVPVIFPQFECHGPLPRHGFARTTLWSFEHATASRTDALAVLALNDNEATQALWPHTFLTELTVRVSANRLDLELAVSNTSLAPFEFTAALHTYLRVDDVAQVQLEGLHRLRYKDKVRGTEQIEAYSSLQVAGEMDRIYFDAARELTLHDRGRRRRVTMTSFHDVVVWNPGPERCAALADMPPEGYQHMLCVEAAAIGVPVSLAAGAEWVARQSIEWLEPGGPTS
jgi:glucose-6-phosphate 1-epimerase